MKKWKDQGYWKSFIYYRMSVLNYWLQSARHWNYTWYEAVNPAIEHGGMLNEKKSAIYPLFDDHYLPKTVYYDNSTAAHEFLQVHRFVFPLIIKPDVGLKGIEVTKVFTEEEALALLNACDERGLIVQEFITCEREYSVLYHRYKNGSYGISSLIEKKYPAITGDGVSTIHQLIDRYPHAYLNRKEVKQWHNDRVLENGEQLVLHHIGNYSRGATFHELQDAIEDTLATAIHDCLKNINGIAFGRLDLKADSLEEVKKGHFKIIEFNGGKAEPLHIYDKGQSYWQAIKTVFNHWKIYNRIASEKLVAGHQTISTADGVRALKKIKKVTKKKKP